jgi:hypothetical protein
MAAPHDLNPGVFIFVATIKELGAVNFDLEGGGFILLELTGLESADLASAPPLLGN